MASGISLLIKGITTMICLVIFILLVFVNGIISPPIWTFIMQGTYTRTFGFEMVPIIQIAIAFMCLAGAIISFVSAYVEIFAEVSYNAGL